MNSERKMATVRRIAELKPIEGADKIELAIVDGWQCVVKKGDFNLNEHVVYLEIDSWVPHKIAPFLTKSGHCPKVYQGVEGQRLKTVKLRGALSQGLILPVSVIGVSSEENKEFEPYSIEGTDVTEILGVLKWEQEVPAQLRGQVEGAFPIEIPKTNQERVQNLRNFDKLKTHVWEVTEKLHGCSATYYLDSEGKFHVCSRNYDLKYDPANTYWQMAEKYSIEEKLRNLCEDEEVGFFGFVVQGEIIGPGINGNQYGLTECEFRVFDLYAVNITNDSNYCDAMSRFGIVSALGMNHVPVINSTFSIENETVDSLLQLADGRSQLNNSSREGLVFKSINDPSISFKVVSNKWLLEGGE